MARPLRLGEAPPASADEKPINESGSVRLKTEFSGGAQDEAARGIIVHVMRLTQVAQRRVAATAAMLPQQKVGALWQRIPTPELGHRIKWV